MKPIFETLEKCRGHVGHRVQYRDKGAFSHGIIQRVTLDLTINVVWVWLKCTKMGDTAIYLKRILPWELQECSCEEFGGKDIA